MLNQPLELTFQQAEFFADLEARSLAKILRVVGETMDERVAPQYAMARMLRTLAALEPKLFDLFLEAMAEVADDSV